MLLPTNQQRILILGKTGTGKTCAAVWHLAQKDFSKEQWIVINHKADELVDSVPNAQFMEMGQFPKPNKPGVFIYHPIPELHDDAVTDLLWKIHARGNIGVYIDEGYMIPNRDPALQALLTQGRSKRIPMIILSQRPVWLTRFAVSESDFFQVFRLGDARDRQTVQGFVPVDLEKLMDSPINEQPLLLPYHSVYYDVSSNKAHILKPVPTAKEVLRLFPNTNKQVKML